MKDFFGQQKISEFRLSEGRKLVVSLIITLLFMFVEIFGGLITKSIALISDAFHMFTHAFTISLSLFAIIITRKPPCHHRTFGLYRAEILAAFVNGLTLLPISGLIIYYSIKRITNPAKILGLEMFVIAILGLFANIASIIILRKDYKNNINIKSVFFHLIGDALSSIAVIFASMLIVFKKWFIADPIVSFGISLLIASWAFSVLKESGKILLEMAPKGLDIEKLGLELKENFPEIAGISSVHIWSITSDMVVFSAHLSIKGENLDQNEFIERVCGYLQARYPIIECTIQIKV